MLHKALDCAVEAASRENFAEAYPAQELARPKAGLSAQLINDLCRNMLQDIRSNVQAEFDTIVTDHDVNRKLNLLDKLIAEQPVSSRTGQRRTVASRNPLDVTRQERIKIKEEEKQKVEALIAELKQENETLGPEIDSMEERLRTTKGALAFHQPAAAAAAAAGRA